MSFFRKAYDFFLMASIAHARWDYEVSMNILHSRRRRLILAFAVGLLPIIAVALADASDMLGGKKAYAPSFYTTGVFLVSIAIGFCAGLITGCIGAGGGFIITPALMAAGVKGILSVGTDLFHIFAKAIMGTVLHKKLGNVSVSIAIAFLVGSIGGATVGGHLQKVIYAKDPVLSDMVVSIIYALILGLLSWYGISDVIKKRRLAKAKARMTAEGIVPVALSKVTLGEKFQTLKIPPMVGFDYDIVPGGKRISALVLAAGGFLVGITSALMGVGGGFITFPLFVYVFGISTFTTVGTDILQIIFTAGYGAVVQYAIYGYVFYTLAMGLLLGSLIGVQIGALTTKVVVGTTIRLFWAVTILAGFINRVTTLPKQFSDMGVLKIPKYLAQGIETGGFYIFWITIAAFVIWVLSNFIRNIKTFREEA